MVLHAAEMKVASKTDELDETLLIDLERDRELGPALERMLASRFGKGWRPRLLKGGANEKLFALDSREVCRLWNLALKGLGYDAVGVVSMYQLRHAGASADTLSALRTLEEVRRRGRWKSWTSVRRYEKGARVTELLHRLSQAALAHALRCGVHVGAVLAGRSLPCAAP